MKYLTLTFNPNRNTSFPDSYTSGFQLRDRLSRRGQLQMETQLSDRIKHLL